MVSARIVWAKIGSFHGNSPTQTSLSLLTCTPRRPARDDHCVEGIDICSNAAEYLFGSNFRQKQSKVQRAANICPDGADVYGRHETRHLSGKTLTVSQKDQCVNTLESDGDGAKLPLNEVQSGHCWDRLSVDKHLNESAGPTRATPRHSTGTDSSSSAWFTKHNTWTSLSSDNSAGLLAHHAVYEKPIDKLVHLPASVRLSLHLSNCCRSSTNH